jgi:polar amino acid transport system substrate-binding protein
MRRLAHPDRRPGQRWRSLGRWRVVVAAGVVALAVLIGLILSGRLGVRDRTWERIQESGVMTVGMEASFPPFEALDNDTGQPVGFDVDLAVMLGQELGGIRVEFVNVGFDSLYDQLLAGRFDVIISALPVDRIWTEDVRYSIPYFEAGLVMVAHRDWQVEITGPNDLPGRPVAVEWGSEGDAYGRQLSRRIGEIDLLPYETPQEALTAVRAGKAAATLVDAVSAYQFIGESDDLVVVGAPLTEASYAVATRRTSPVLATKINDALIRLRDAGALDELLRRWL